MKGLPATNKVAQPFHSVNTPLNTQLPLLPDTMTHHSNVIPKVIRGNKEKVWRETGYYGVSSYYRILPKELFLKRYDQIRQFLKGVLGLPTAEREFILRAAFFGSYYGNCYAKVSTLCEKPGCSKATAFRVLRKLKEKHLIKVIPRIITPFRRQTSSIILFHKLFLLIARYLAEHGVQFGQKWLKPYLTMAGQDFWALAWISEHKSGDRIWGSQTP